MSFRGQTRFSFLSEARIRNDQKNGMTEDFVFLAQFLLKCSFQRFLIVFDRFYQFVWCVVECKGFY